MAYSLTSLVDKVRQTLQGAAAQAPTTLAGLGNRVSSNLNWAGQQAQQGASSLGKTLSQGLNTFDKGVTSLSNNPNPLVNFMPKAIVSAANANIKYNQAVQSKPVTFSKSGLQNYIDQQRLKLEAGLKTASPVLDVALAPTVGAATYLGSAGIGAAFGAGSQLVDNITNKRNPFANVAQSAGYGAQQGLVQAPKISTIASVTNPVINQAAGKVIAKFPKLSEVGKAIVNRVVQGTLSVPEGIAMAKATGQDYSVTNAAIDFAVGSGLAKKAGTMAIEGPYGGGEAGKIGTRTPDQIRSDKLLVAIDKALSSDRLQKNSMNPKNFNDIGELTNIRDQMIKGVDNVENQYKANYILDKNGLSADKSVGSAGFAKLNEPIGKVPPEVKTQPEILPWETPEYLAKNPSTAGTQSQSVAPSKLKQELNRPVVEANQKSASPSITPELFTDIQSTGKAIDRKVNLLDYLRTPDRVLEKIGLKKQSDGVKQAYNAYLDELPKQIDKITGWYDQTKTDPNSAQKLFQYLDGNKSIQLDPVQLKVAGEMRQYLDQWAERLNLPVENRMANYMTHIFEKDFIQKEFDPELAKIIQDKIPGSVYDPFLQQRLGKLGYVEDAFRALDAYTKRAVRKANMDPALEKLKLSSESLDLQSWNYVKSYADRINLRPTELDNLFDNAIKQSPIGYKLGQRPVTAVSRTLRQMVYRGTLGLNVGSALRNLTQGANTYAQLGEKYTGIGYVKALKEIATGGDELLSSGVLRDNVVQDRQLSAVKGVMEKLDSGLFSFFNFAEKINRGAAYFGAKAKYLSEGASETEAIKKAVDMTRKTQFTFGSVDTPVAMQSDLVKTFSQFQSFNMKQTEFLAEMVKNKEFTGIIRYVGANLLLMATVGQLIGMKVEDMIPFSGVLTGQTKLGQTPPVKLAGDVVGALTNAPDKYGNVSKDNLPTRLGGVLMNNAPAFIPGGVQIKKTIQGLQAVNEGGSFSKTGKLQYPVPNDPITTTRAALFGKSNLPQAQKYFDSGATVLSDKQTQQFKDATDKQSAYDAVIKKRADAKTGTPKKTPTLKLKAPKKASTKKTATKSASLRKVRVTKAPKVKKITIKRFKPKTIAYKPLKLGKIKVSLT